MAETRRTRAMWAILDVKKGWYVRCFEFRAEAEGWIGDNERGQFGVEPVTVTAAKPIARARGQEQENT